MKTTNLNLSKYLFYFLTTLLTISTYSCSNDDDAAVDQSPVLNLLVAKEVNGTEELSIKNESGNYPLDVLTNYRMSAMVMENSTVYTSGYYRNGAVSNGVYWQDTDAQPLPDTGNTVFTTDIALDQGDVYISGREFISGSGNFAKIWVNGVITNLETPQLASSVAEAIAVQNGDSYTCGYIRPPLGGNSRAVVWENETRIDLSRASASSSSTARDITIYDNDYYSAGYESNSSPSYGKIWKNDQSLFEIVIPNKSLNLESIDVYEGDVYSLGSTLALDGSGLRTLEYFKNNISVAVLAQSTTSLNPIQIKVVNGDVYCLGYYEDAQGTPTTSLWKNGVIQEIPFVTTQDFIYAFDVTM